MDVLEYINPSTIPDISTRNTLATTITPLVNPRLYSSVVSGVLDGPNNNYNNNNNNSKKATLLINDLDASSHLTAPTFDAAGRLRANLNSNSSNGFPNIFQLCNSAIRLLPKTAALLQRKVCQYLPLVWTVSPPVLHVNPLASPTSHYQHHYRAEQLENFFGGNLAQATNGNGGARTAATVARFVALHPHRRLIAVAAPHEGSSRHSAVVVYDLSFSSENNNNSNNNNNNFRPQPKQVLRNVLIRDLCGICWKPGSRNILIAYGSLGVSMFHLSVDPRTGLDVEDPKNEFLTSGTNQSSSSSRVAARNGGSSNINNNSAPALVLPSAGSASSTAVPSVANSDLGVGCLYPVSSQLSRFGIEPQIDRIAFYPDSNGRFVACGSTSSSGLRIIDLAFTPMEQLFSDWNSATSTTTATSGKTNNQNIFAPKKLISGTFVGSPQGSTSDLSWIYPSAETSTTFLLLRAVRDVKLIEIFAAGISTPVAQLHTEHPVEQLEVVSWPNLADTSNQQSVASRNISLGIDSKAKFGQSLVSSSNNSNNHGDDGSNNNNNTTNLAPTSTLEPNRHVGVWVLFQKTEGVVLYDLAFNEQKIHLNTPIYCVPLIRLSTTVATPFRRGNQFNNNNSDSQQQIHHPGGVVSRFVTAKEVGSNDSGTIFMSVDSGHVISVKISRSGTLATANKVNSSFVYQTSIISPTLDDDENEENSQERNENGDDDDDENDFDQNDNERRSRRSSSARASKRIAFSELVGVFGSSSVPFGPTDANTLVTWNGQENVAQLISVKAMKIEKNQTD